MKIPEDLQAILEQVAALYDNPTEVLALLRSKVRKKGNAFSLIDGEGDRVDLASFLEAQKRLHARREATGMNHTHGGLEVEFRAIHVKDQWSPRGGKKGALPSLEQIDRDPSLFG